MVNDQSHMIHGFLTRHPIGRAISQHTRYGPGHAVHDVHAAAMTPGMSAPGPSSALGPMNPALMQQMMQAGPGGPGGSPLPMPNSPQPERSLPPPQGAAPPGPPGR